MAAVASRNPATIVLGRTFLLLVLHFAALASCQTLTNEFHARALGYIKQNLAASGQLDTIWPDGMDPCASWVGIACVDSQFDGKLVTAIVAYERGLAGKLTDDLTFIKSLQILDLRGNPGITGPIPQSYGSLTALTTLTLDQCGLTGTPDNLAFPASLGNLKSLSTLSLSENKLFGSIPTTISNLTSLYWFDMSNNKISGFFPDIGSLPAIIHMHFYNNSFTGSIPASVFKPKLRHLLLSGNMFSGPLDLSQVGATSTSLQILDLSGNQVSGPLPPELSTLTGLRQLQMTGNQFSGALPDGLDNLANLVVLDVSNNQLNGTLPAMPTSINSIRLSNNSLTGTIPPDWASLPALIALELQNNALTGSVPLDFGEPQSQPLLQLVNLQNNRLTAPRPDALLQRRDVLTYLAGNDICTTANLGNVCVANATVADPNLQGTSAPRCTGVICPGRTDPNPALGPDGRPLCNCAGFLQIDLVFVEAAMGFDPIQATLLEAQLAGRFGLATGQVFVSDWQTTSPAGVRPIVVRVNTEWFPADSASFALPIETQRNISESLGRRRVLLDTPFATFNVLDTTFSEDAQGAGGGSSKLGLGALIGIIVACVAALVVLAAVVLYAVSQKRRAEKAEVQVSVVGKRKNNDLGDIKLKGAHVFSVEELTKATGNFAEANVVGRGGYGKVYRGELGNGSVVAIKQAEKTSRQGATEFNAEIALLSRVHHKNLVNLVGFCHESGEQMLVYEFMAGGTLRENLHTRAGSLSFVQRLDIAVGTARGLAYLHNDSDPSIIHRDIKTANILLDKNMVAKVADFGLSKEVEEHGHVSTHVKGTLGYLDPEYYMTQKLTDKSDVFSFGVVLLELMTGRQPIVQNKYIVKEVVSLWEEKGLAAVFDPRAVDAPWPVEVAEEILRLGIECTRNQGNDRPSMLDTVKTLESLKKSYMGNSHSQTMSATTGTRSPRPKSPRRAGYTKGIHEGDSAISIPESERRQMSGAIPSDTSDAFPSHSTIGNGPRSPQFGTGGGAGPANPNFYYSGDFTQTTLLPK